MDYLNENLKHVDGNIALTIELDGEQAVIYFGKSFTLRLEEEGLCKLADVIQTGLDEIRYNRRQFNMDAEAKFVQIGIDARELAKQRSLVSGEEVEDKWNPNDPISW
jgi:hypothetical protein